MEKHNMINYSSFRCTCAAEKSEYYVCTCMDPDGSSGKFRSLLQTVRYSRKLIKN